jgi:hypothetical protein
VNPNDTSPYSSIAQSPGLYLAYQNMGQFFNSVVTRRLTQGKTGTCILKNIMPREEVEVEALFFQKSYPHLLLFCLVIFNGYSPDIMGENCNSFYTL